MAGWLQEESEREMLSFFLTTLLSRLIPPKYTRRVSKMGNVSAKGKSEPVKVDRFA